MRPLSPARQVDDGQSRPSLPKSKEFLAYPLFNTVVLSMSSPKRQARETSFQHLKARGSASKPTGSELTRQSLIAIAEQLFAKRGLDAVSLIEIGVAAGQKNRSAVQYHFGNKANLLEAIRTKHQVRIEERRAQRLDALEEVGSESLRDFVEILVYPLAEEALNPDGGAAYVRMTAELVGHPEFSPLARERTARAHPARLLGHIIRTAPRLPSRLVEPRMLLVAGMLFRGMADRSRVLTSSMKDIDPADWEGFARDLVDCIVSVLEAPASDPNDTESARFTFGQGWSESGL